MDFIPDFIPLVGLLDDVSVITFVLASIKTDLDKFKTWEEATLKNKDGQDIVYEKYLLNLPKKIVDESGFFGKELSVQIKNMKIIVSIKS